MRDVTPQRWEPEWLKKLHTATLRVMEQELLDRLARVQRELQCRKTGDVYVSKAKR